MSLKRPIQPPFRVSPNLKEDTIDFPYLTEMIRRSWVEFLQDDRLPSERDKKAGLEEVFQDVFPIKSHAEQIILEYKHYTLGEPKYAASECIRRGTSFTIPLHVRLKARFNEQEIEEDVYMGQIPKMTDKGTFIINGAERVIVSQLHRSPGITFEQEKGSKGTMIHSARIIPYRGSWLEIVFDSSDLIWVYIDRKRRRRKILATTFIRALGYSLNSDILHEFFETKLVHLRGEKDFPKLRGKYLAEDILDPESAENEHKKIAHAGESLSSLLLQELLVRKITGFRIAEGADSNHPIIKMLEADQSQSSDDALIAIFRKLRPGEPVTGSSARSLILRLYFDEVRYNLGRVGRYKINMKLGVKSDDKGARETRLRKEDIILTLKYLVALKEGKAGYTHDDIDHLGNRRVRSVGELLQNQCRIGLARAEKTAKEKMLRYDLQDSPTPNFLFAQKGLSVVISDFFQRSQLSQFMDQTNPLAELTHKRRLSSLGPGGLSRDRAGFEVRDVHSSHYGRICPIETPEGPNIGLITSLSCFAKINEYGFIETPYRRVEGGLVTDQIEYMTADQEEGAIIAPASMELDNKNRFKVEACWARHRGDFIKVEIDRVSHIDVSPKQLISIVTALIPFLEHDDANRALMGSNMQRQAVPLMITDAPVIGTGIERRAAIDSGAVIVAEEDGVIEYVDGFRIVLATAEQPSRKITYLLKNFMRSNAGTCITQNAICCVGDIVKRGEVLADGPSTDKGELALGKNVLVAFMPWYGYNFEDAIIISEELIKKDAFTSIYIEDFDVVARETKLGKEEITANLPHVSLDALRDIGEDGVIRIGAEVNPGDILVGKITPKAESEPAPERRLINAIFSDNPTDVKNTSLIVPPGTSGVVIEVKKFNRQDRSSKTDEELVQEDSEINKLRGEKRDRLAAIEAESYAELILLLSEQSGNEIKLLPCPGNIVNARTGDILFAEGDVLSPDDISTLLEMSVSDLFFYNHPTLTRIKEALVNYGKRLDAESLGYDTQIEQLRKGDPELGAGVIQHIKVTLATKRKLEVGDKMAGRHGNKGVVSRIVPEVDMPYLEDGRPIQIILNPLGVPSRMNIGQLLETHLGLAAMSLGIYIKTPVFESFPEEEIFKKMREANLPESGKLYMRDGYTGERFDNAAVVGYIYMMKLGHLVADKIHARSTGPYSLVTQQPLGGKAQMGGQRFGEMEVWALEAYGAAHTLQEMLTVKSDDVYGRTKIYDSIISGVNNLQSGIPESFNVLQRELKGLALDIRTVIVEEDALVRG